MALNFPHNIFDPLSCTRTQWIADKVMIEHSLHSVPICDIHTARYPLECVHVCYSECAAVHIQRAVIGKHLKSLDVDHEMFDNQGPKTWGMLKYSLDLRALLHSRNEWKVLIELS